MRAVRNRAFDLRHRTDTCRKFIEADTRVMTGPNAVYGSQYSPADGEALRKAIRSLRIKYSEYTLVDLGSGKGKAVMVAANFPFRSVVGIEYSRLLNRVARANLENPNRPFTRSHSVHIVHADAVHFPPPEGPLVVLLCDPFRGPVLRDMLQHLKSNIEENPRPLKLIYMNPREPDLISGALGFWPTMQLVRRQHGVRIFNLDLARVRRQLTHAAPAAEAEPETPGLEAPEVEVPEVAVPAMEAPDVAEPVTAEPEVTQEVPMVEADAQAERTPEPEPVAAPLASSAAADGLEAQVGQPVRDETLPEPIAVVSAKAGQVIEFPKREVAAASGTGGSQQRRGPGVETRQVELPRAVAAAAGSPNGDLAARNRPELTLRQPTGQDPAQEAEARRKRSAELAAAIREAVRYSREKAGKAKSAAQENPDGAPSSEAAADSAGEHRTPSAVESGAVKRTAAQKNGTHHEPASGSEKPASEVFDPATDSALRNALYGRSPDEWPEDE